MENILKVDNLTKAFGEKVVFENINLSIHTGEIHSIIGRNGAGKSTFVNSIIGMLKPDNGSIKICGSNINKQNWPKEKIGVLPEFNPIIKELNLNEYLKYIGLIYKIDKNVISERVKKLMNIFFQGENISGKEISQFSKGMKLKAGLCAAVLHKPKFLILDEPFDGLDPLSRSRLTDFLKNYRKKKNAVLVTSHDLASIEKISTNISFIKDKKLIHIPEDIIKEFEGNIETYIINNIGYDVKGFDSY